MDKIVNKINFKVIMIISIIILYTYLFSTFSFKYFYITTCILQIFILGVIFFKILKIYFKYFINYMFTIPNNTFNKLIEKPRLLFHLFFIPINIVFTSGFINIISLHEKGQKSLNLLNINDSYLLLFIINIVLIGFVFSVLGIYYSWTKKFENQFIPMIEEKLKSLTVIIEYNEENNLKELYDNELIYNNRCEVSFQNLELFAKGQKMSEKIKWIDKKGQKSTTDAKSKEITFGFIFDMLHENIIKDGIKNLKGKRRSLIMDLIVENFTKDNEMIKKGNINKSYNNWTPVKYANPCKNDHLIPA